MIRVVLDTNILVSALLQPQGVPARTFLTTLLLFTRTHGANTVLPFYFGWNIGACDLPLGCRRGSGAESPRHPEFSSATLNTSAPQPARRRPPLVNYVVSVAAEIQPARVHRLPALRKCSALHTALARRRQSPTRELGSCPANRCCDSRGHRPGHRPISANLRDYFHFARHPPKVAV